MDSLKIRVGSESSQPGPLGIQFGPMLGPVKFGRDLCLQFQFLVWT